METETLTVSRTRWEQHCTRCGTDTEPDTAACTHCAVCGDRY